MFAIADLLSGHANSTDSSCLLICDCTQTISTDSFGDIGTYNVAHHPPQITYALNRSILDGRCAWALLGIIHRYFDRKTLTLTIIT
jgi:hypothetical protein